MHVTAASSSTPANVLHVYLFLVVLRIMLVLSMLQRSALQNVQYAVNGCGLKIHHICGMQIIGLTASPGHGSSLVSKMSCQEWDLYLN